MEPIRATPSTARKQPSCPRRRPAASANGLATRTQTRTTLSATGSAARPLSQAKPPTDTAIARSGCDRAGQDGPFLAHGRRRGENTPRDTNRHAQSRRIRSGSRTGTTSIDLDVLREAPPQASRSTATIAPPSIVANFERVTTPTRLGADRHCRMARSDRYKPGRPSS